MRVFACLYPLAAYVDTAPADRWSAFIENHVADNLGTALEHAIHFGSLSRRYLQASPVGNPVELDYGPLDATIEKFAEYGQKE